MSINTGGNLYGITGLAGSGKDTVASLMAEANKRTITMAFADHLKDIVALSHSWPRHLLEGDCEESRDWREEVDPDWGVTPRRVLQEVGIGFRNIDEDFWVNHVRTQITRMIEPPPDDSLDFPVIITDVRFANEFRMIRELGGKIIHVKRSRQNPPWWNDAVRLNRLKEYNRNKEMNPSQRANFLRKMDSDVASFQKRYPDLHPSEWSSAGETLHFTIINDGTLSDLRKSVTSDIIDLQ